jgi:ferredoxin
MGTEWVTPPDLRGRQRSDRMFRGLGTLITFYDWLTAAFAHRPPIRRVDRELSLVVDEVRIEAQDVRSLRLVATGGSGRPWQLVYTGRSPASMPFLTELTALDPARVRLRPYDQYGFPSTGAELLQYAPAGATVYCCAPPITMANVRRDRPASAAAAVHFERFTTPPIVGGAPFEIELQRSKRVLAVPEDRSALDVIRDTVPDVAYSCRQGFCGTCRTRVISGEIDHRDRVLTDRERTDTMTICVSRGRNARIVLDR